MIRLILDQGLPRRAAQSLRLAGINAQHVREFGMSAATDTEILKLAVSEQAVVVTLDSDFAQLVATQGLQAPSVIRLRLQHLNVKAAGSLLIRVLDTAADDLAVGAIFSVTPRGVRVRRLPVTMSGSH